MARGKSLSGVCAAGSAIVWVLQGCGSSAPTPVPKTSPVQACIDNGQWNPEIECCCMTCPSLTGGAAFGIQDKVSCTTNSGQCKEEVMSSYSRPSVSARAHESLMVKSATGGPEQHHLIGGYPDEVTIVFIYPGDNTPQTVEYQVHGTNQSSTQSTVTSSYSFFQNPDSWNGYEESSRGNEYLECTNRGKLGYPDYMNATCFYTSDMIHKALLTGLNPDTSYDYRMQGEDTWITFKTPPAVGSPISFAVVADMGQSGDAVSTMQHMKTGLDAGDFDAVIFPGDLSYADGFADDWDHYGRLSEFLLSRVVGAYGVGNHEYTNGLENFVNFLPRYGWESSKSTSSTGLWYSFDAGLAHVINVCSYCATAEGTPQFLWLQKDLAAVDRTLTPWVVLALHIPMYTSSLTHNMNVDGPLQRRDLEGLIYDNKVDVVFQGHVHAYERTGPVYQNETKCDGPVYITIGDGGNHEGPACGFTSGLPWSLRKEYSFGHGIFSIINATDGDWSWHRNQDGEKVFADSTPLKTSSTRSCAAEGGPAAAVTV